MLIENYIKDYVARLDNVTVQLRNVRAMRIGKTPLTIIKIIWQIQQNNPISIK